MNEDLGRRISGLSPEKRALLEAHLLRQGRHAADDDPIPRRRPGEPVPLSFSQLRLWFLDQWAPGNPAYNAGIALRLHGPVDAGRLRAAFTLVIGRHEAVRTVFRAPAGEPQQVVLDDWSFDLAELDLSSVREPARTVELSQLLRAEARQPFDLTADLMLRGTLFQLDTDDAVLLLSEHHIAFDGWSDAILFAEVAEAYAALGSGREPQLPPLPVQYADFALWQRRRLSGPLLDRLTDYWRSQLAGAPPLLELPTDHPRPRVVTFAGAHHRFSLGPAVLPPLQALARSESATAYMALLAVFAAALHGWAGCRDLCVGTPIANRGRVELEPLIGFFSNTLVLRLQLDGGMTFRSLLRQVKETALGAYEHQELPFEKVVEAVRPPRDPSHNPLFQVNFRVQASPAQPLRIPGVEVSPLPIDVGFARFDLAVEIQLGAGVTGYVEYNETLFEPATAAGFADRFRQVLTTALAHPDVPLARLVAPAGPTSAGEPAALPSLRRRRA